MLLDEFLDPQGVAFGMAVTDHRIGAARGLDPDLGPEQAGLDVHGRHLGDADADLIATEPRPLASGHRLVAYFDDGSEEAITAREAGRVKELTGHATSGSWRQSNASPG